jgi:hypothetical protein
MTFQPRDCGIYSPRTKCEHISLTVGVTGQISNQFIDSLNIIQQLKNVININK